jgi:uncharacterized membrane protein
MAQEKQEEQEERVMSRRHIPGWLFGILSGWLIGELAILWPRLPQRLATHFGIYGEPNGWSTPSQFLIMMAALLGIFVALFTMAGWLDRIPDRFVNLPNKGYWLATDRRVATLATLREWLHWFLVITFAALVVLMSAMLRANLLEAPHLSISPLVAFAGLVLPQVIMIAWLYRRFRLPRDT